jgi:hypothetical protein
MILIRKGLVIVIILLFIGINIIPSAARMLEKSSEISCKRYNVFGFGAVWYIAIINSSWNRIAYETNHSLRGFFYKANIYVTNSEGMDGFWYCLFFSIYNKNILPWHFYIYNFTGFIGLSYIFSPYSYRGCGFYLIGKADDFQSSTYW